MKKYAFLADRFYKFSKYLRNISLVSLIIFLVTDAISTGNSDILYIVSYIFMMITLVTAVEAVILYVLSFVLKK